MHRLLVMNIDGTVLQPNGRLHKSAKEAVEYVQNKGVKVTLCTSRNFHFAKRIARAMKLESMIIAHHGGFIASSVDQAIFVKRLNEDIVYDLVRFLESFTCTIRLVHEKYLVTNKQKGVKEFTGRAVMNPKNQSVYYHQIEENLSDYVWNEQIAPLHIEVDFNNKNDAKEAQTLLKAMYYEVGFSLHENRLVILPQGVSKLTGLLYAADYWNISLDETVAIGSQLDDLEIIEAVGLGVAMGNAPKELKEAAGWITRTNSEHGVSYMVREHFRKQQPIDFLEKMNILKK